MWDFKYVVRKPSLSIVREASGTCKIVVEIILHLNRGRQVRDVKTVVEIHSLHIKTDKRLLSYFDFIELLKPVSTPSFGVPILHSETFVFNFLSYMPFHTKVKIIVVFKKFEQSPRKKRLRLEKAKFEYSVQRKPNFETEKFNWKVSCCRSM